MLPSISLSKIKEPPNKSILKEFIMMKGLNQVFDAITYFVEVVASFSLFITGIGVINMMYISVSERTEEIAIRRAFGAKSQDIELQFLV